MSLMSFTRVLIGIVREFDHQHRQSTEDLQYRIMMQKKRLRYFLGSIFITSVFTIVNGIMLNTKLSSPWGWVYSVAMSLVIEITTPWFLRYLAFLGISMDTLTSVHLFFNLHRWVFVIICLTFTLCSISIFFMT